MPRLRLSCVATLAVIVGCAVSASAQSYQRYSDGLISVHAKKVLVDQQVGFEVCAELTEPEKACAVEVHLTFRTASGRLLAHALPVLRPDSAAPACTRIDLPDEAKDMARWEISRFRCKRPQADRSGGAFLGLRQGG